MKKKSMHYYLLTVGSIFLVFLLIGCGGGSSISLANSYETLEELTEASDLIVEANINGVHSVREAKDSTLYNATLTDVLKGSPEEEIIITQLGVEADTAPNLQIDRENPLMEPGEEYILFLKHGEDGQVGDIYYVSGEYQGKYQVQGEQVFSVNQDAQTPATVDGESLPQFKEKINRIVQTQS